MALIKDYEIPGTGLIVPNAYHVVTSVRVEKRMADQTPPADSSRADGLTQVDMGPEVYWKAGYIGHVIVTIWASKSARDTGKDPIGFAGESPTETEFNGTIGTPGLDGKCMFMIDINAPETDIQQAYAHLLTTSFYTNTVFD